MAKRIRTRRRRRGSKKFLRYERLILNFSKTMLGDLQRLVTRALVPPVKTLAANFKANDEFGDADYFDDLIEQVEAQFLGRFPKSYIKQNIRRIFQDLGIDVDETVMREIGFETLRIAPDTTQQEIINRITSESVSRIQNLAINTIGEIRGEVTEGLRRGERWESIAKRLEKPITTGNRGKDKPTPLQKAYSQARFIARNEVGTALGELNKNQQETAGVELYEWVTAQDERVRSSHADLGREPGNIYSWSGTVKINGVTYKEAYDRSYNGGQNVIPGEAYNCRCVAIPFIPEVEEE